MDLIQSFDLNDLDHLLTLENWAYNSVPFQIWVDGDTGEVRFTDPSDFNFYYQTYLPTRNLSGNWISLRTNGLSLSFGEGL